VYVQSFPPTGARYKVTAAGGVSPVWAPDGKRLYFVSGSQLHVATLQTTPSFTVLSRAEAFEGSIQYDIISPLYAFFDVSPDGKHFALLRPAPGNETRLVVVHGWQHELQKVK
jgi:hypothetical protein